MASPQEICSQHTQICPVCTSLHKTTLLLAADLCPVCGSLEGLDTKRDLPEKSGLVGHEWAKGSVAPWRTRDGSAAYRTRQEDARAALLTAGLQPLPGITEEEETTGEAAVDFTTARRAWVVIDLGCGDAQILRVAALSFGARGVGVELDKGALVEAREKMKTAGLVEGDLITFQTADLMKLDLCSEVQSARQLQQDHTEEGVMDVNVVITAFLLPDTLQRLRPRLEECVARGGATVVTFKWDMGGRWQGPQLGEKNREHNFTIYRPAAVAVAGTVLSVSPHASLGSVSSSSGTKHELSKS